MLSEKEKRLILASSFHHVELMSCGRMISTWAFAATIRYIGGLASARRYLGMLIGCLLHLAVRVTPVALPVSDLADERLRPFDSHSQLSANFGCQVLLAS